jgi:transposase
VGGRPRRAGQRRDHAAGHRAAELDPQKKTLYATEQDPVKRAAWWATIAGVPAKQLVFLDETSANIRLTRTHARAPRGVRAVGRVPRNHGRPTTLVAALTPRGLRAPLTQLGAVNAGSFAAYVRDVLCPRLRPGQVVVMDNLSVHKAAAVREAIEAARCTLVFLPPYSPDFTPIELAFAKLKAALRAVGARTHEALHAAIATALRQITAADARGFFHHCGYRLTQRH